MKRITNWSVIVMMVIGMLMTTACEKDDSIINPADEAALKAMPADGTNNQLVFVETADLTEQEIEMLQFMKEEEKLARDVYYALFDKWSASIFSNISKAEQQHISAIVRLMEFYNLETTAVGEPGVFENEHFTSLYNELVAKGSVSLDEALMVGALIEDLDIKDLADDIALTENANLDLVFSNLIRGSRNHLRAFTSQLSSLGLTYTPQYISQEEYDAIINSPMERGNGNGNGSQGGNGYGQKGQGNGYGSGNGSGTGTGECDGTGRG